MNVVKRDKYPNFKSKYKRDQYTGIRGALTIPNKSFISNFTRSVNKAPRYLFNNDEPIASTSTMGPPLHPPRNLKRKLKHNSSTSRLESSSSCKTRPIVLASDSATDNMTTHGFATPNNRPIRYISSSSKGGYTGNRSVNRSTTSTSVLDPSVILAISEGRGLARGEIGIAAVDLRHPNLVLCQFSDTLLYTHTLSKINYFNPVEILVPHTFSEGAKPNQLYQLIKDNYPFLTLTPVQRRHFNDAAGLQQIQSLCALQYRAVFLQVSDKFYALTAAAAVLKYVEYIQCVVYARESLKIEYHSSANTMIIDVGTATQLELVQPLKALAGPNCCLLGILGPTFTTCGLRALRATILQPSCNKEFIENRLDAVQELIENETGLIANLQDVLKKLCDIDKILLLCLENQNVDNTGEAQLNQVLLLKTTMDLVPTLAEALESCDSGRLKKMHQTLCGRFWQVFSNPSYRQIYDRILDIINTDAHQEKGASGNLQRCYAVKPNVNGLLDVARKTYSELIEDMHNIVQQLAKTHEMPLRLHQTMMRGFHIVLPIAPKNRGSFNVEDLPPILIQVQHNGASVSMSTEEIVVMDQQTKESMKEILKMSNIIIAELLKKLRPFMASLYELCENVAELDILLAFAQTSMAGSYMRPDFSDYMNIRNSLHPLLEYNCKEMPTRNDITASPEHNFTLITGPNMGGKSIYIKQIAILQIMAQMGCFLPATTAVLRLTDRLFSRLGFNDSVQFNASTYVLEMKEVQHILKSVTKSSLIIIDELCRGTSTDEGTSMAWAICEELMISEAFTFFTTHFMYLTRLGDLYGNVVRLHTAVREESTPQDTENPQEISKKIIYLHKIENGVTNIDNYGLALAANTNLPKETVKLAKELAEILKDTLKPPTIFSPIVDDERILYELNAKIWQEYRKHYDVDTCSTTAIINKFKEDNPQLIERLTVERSKHRFSAVINKDSSTNVNVTLNKNSTTNSDRGTQLANVPTITSVLQEYERIENEFRTANNEDYTVDINLTSTRIIHREDELEQDQLKSMLFAREIESNKNIINEDSSSDLRPTSSKNSTTNTGHDNSSTNITNAEHCIKKRNENNATVKSSEQLLNTIMDNEETREINYYTPTNKNHNSNYSNIEMEFDGYNNMKNDIDVSDNYNRKAIHDFDKSRSTINFEDNVNVMSDILTSNTNNSSDSDDSNDVPTQIINISVDSDSPLEASSIDGRLADVNTMQEVDRATAESDDKISMESQESNDFSFSTDSDDENLMKETINEINEELKALDIILPPPPGFE